MEMMNDYRAPDPWTARSADVFRKRNRKGGTSARVTRPGVAPVVGSTDRDVTGAPVPASWAMELERISPDRTGADRPALRRRFREGFNGADVLRVTERLFGADLAEHVGSGGRSLLGSDATGRAFSDESPRDAIYGPPVAPEDRADCADPSDAALLAIHTAGLDGRAVGSVGSPVTWVHVPTARRVETLPERYRISTPRLRASEAEHADALVTGADRRVVRVPITDRPEPARDEHGRIIWQPESNANTRTVRTRTLPADRIHVGNRTVPRGPLARTTVTRTDLPAGPPDVETLRNMQPGDKLRGTIGDTTYHVNRTPDGTRWNGYRKTPTETTRFTTRTPIGAHRHITTTNPTTTAPPVAV